MNLAYTLSGNQVRTNRVFNPGGLYPQDLNTLQEIHGARFGSLAELFINPGIVSEFDPNILGSSLSVAVEGDYFTVKSGKAVFQDGVVFEMPADVSFSLEVPTGVDTSYVLVLERYKGSSDQRYNSALDRAETTEESWLFSFKLLTTGEFLPLSVLNTNMVFLTQVLVDSSQTSFSTLSSSNQGLQRSWFSAKDIEHRGKVGSGILSDTNPHGLSLEDLSSSVGLSYWRQQDITGAVSAVLSGDRYGDLVKVFIPAVDLQNAPIPVGQTSAFYYDIPGGAAHILTVRDVANESGTAFNFTYERSYHRVIVFGIPVGAGGRPSISGLYAHCLVVHAGTVAVKNGASAVLTVESPMEGEFLVTPDGVIRYLNQTELDLGPLGGSSDTFLIKADSSGNIYPNPYPLLQTDLTQLKISPKFDTLYLQRKSYVNYYLTNFVVSNNFVVELRVRGLLDGVSQEEIVRLVGPGSDDPEAYKFNIPVGTNLLAAASDTTVSQRTLAPEASKQWTAITSIDVLSASSDLPSNLGIALTYSVEDSDSVPLASVVLSRKGSVVSLADIREQRIFFERQTGDLLHENFHNPVHFDPLWTTYQGRGLADGQWVSRPFKLRQGTYQVVLNLDAYASDSDSLQVALIRNYGNAPAPTYMEIEESGTETGNSKKVYQFNTPADDWYTLKVTASAGTRVASLWLATSVSEATIRAYIDSQLEAIALIPGPTGPAGPVGPTGPTGPAGASADLPTGSITMFAGTTGTSVPAGFLMCNGASVSRTTYAALYAVIGNTYGSVNSSSFNLPDLQGRFPLGAGLGSGLTNRVLGSKGGEEAHILTIPEMASHTHSYNAGERLQNIGGGEFAAGPVPGNVALTSGSAGNDQPHNNMPPFISLNFIIKV